MKIAPIHQAFSSRQNEHEPLLVHTGRHYSRKCLRFLPGSGQSEADLNLDAGSGSHAEQTARIMMALSRFISNIAWIG